MRAARSAAPSAEGNGGIPTPQSRAAPAPHTGRQPHSRLQRETKSLWGTAATKLSHSRRKGKEKNDKHRAPPPFTSGAGEALRPAPPPTAGPAERPLATSGWREAGRRPFSASRALRMLPTPPLLTPPPPGGSAVWGAVGRVGGRLSRPRPRLPGAGVRGWPGAF